MTREEFDAETARAWGGLVWYAYTWLKDEDSANEAALMALEELTKKKKYLNFQNDRDGATFASWFKSAIKYRCIDILRKEQNRRRLEARGPRSRKRDWNEPIEEDDLKTNYTHNEQFEESHYAVDYIPGNVGEPGEEGMSLKSLELRPGSEEVLYSDMDGEDETVPDRWEDVPRSDPCRCQRIAVQRILDVLTPDLRHVTYLLYWYDLTYPEVADRIGLTQRQAQLRWEEAKARMKQYATQVDNLDEMLHCDDELRLPKRRR